MVLNDYCMVVMGDTLGSISEIKSISDLIHGIIDAKGVLVVTFSSHHKLSSLEDFFVENNRNFFIFDLSKDCSVFNLVKKDQHEGLFGFLQNKLIIDNRFFTHEESNVISVNKNRLNKKEIEGLNKKEKEKIFDELLQIGLENLTEHDKELLYLLC